MRRQDKVSRLQLERLLQDVAFSVALTGVLVAGSTVAVLILPVERLLWLGVLAAVALIAAQPLRRWPAIALTAYALVPVNYLPGRTIGANFSPGAMVLAGWLLVVAMRPGNWAPASVRVVAGASGVWIVCVNLWSAFPTGSWTWTFNFFVGFLGVALVASKSPEGTARDLTRTWMWLGIVLGTYAIVEYALAYNPLYGGSLGDTLVQHWSVYRVTTTLGHPLVGATFFATSFAVGVGVWLSDGNQRVLALVAAAFSIVGGVLTGSRSVILAFGVVAVIAVAFTLRRRSNMRPGVKAALALGLAAAIAAGYLSPLIRARSNSAEASLSSADRDVVSTIALAAAEDYSWLGAGSGISQQVLDRVAPTAPILESAYYQILISLGIPGLALLTLLLGLLIWLSWRNWRPEAVGAFAVLGLMALAFNFLESYKPGIVLFGFAAVLALASERREVSGDKATEEAALVPGDDGTQVAHRG